MERVRAYQASDGSLYHNSREWVEREFFLLLCSCTVNADKQMAAELVDRFKDFHAIHDTFVSDVKYGEGKRLGLVLDRRTLVEDRGPRINTKVIPQDEPEWRNKSRDHPRGQAVEEFSDPGLSDGKSDF